MADGEVKIGVELDDSKAKASAQKTGNDIAKGVESGLKGVGKSADSAAKDIDKSFSNASKSAKSSMSGVGDAAKSSFGDVGDAARDASSDVASAFESIPSDASGAFSDVGSQAQSGFDGVTDAASSTASDAASAFESIPSDAAGSFSDTASQAESGFSGIVDAAESAADGVNNAFDVKVVAIGNIIADAVGQAVSQLGELARQAIETGMEFDKSMSQVAATMGMTTDEIGELTDFAKEMGAATAFSATQSAEALNYMALAGYDAQTSMEMLPTVLNLAAAGGMELATASDMVTDAQSALGLSLEETTEMVDKMAMASSKSNTSVEQLGNAFLTVGGTAKNLKGGTTELATALGILADNGIKGAEGGTALRNIILSLSAPTDKARESIEALGLEVFDAQGNMRGLDDIFNDLNGTLSTMTQGEQTQVLNEIFNKVDLKSVNALLANTGARFDELSGYIDNSAGAAQRMAETQLDNFAGDVTLLQSATEGLSIQISDALTPALRSMTQFATSSIIPALSSMVSNFGKVAKVIAGLAVSFAAFKVYRQTMKAYQAAVAATGISVEQLTTKQKLNIAATKAATTATKAFASVSNLLKSALPMLAITAAVEAVTLFVDAMKDAQEKAAQFDKATSGLVSSFDEVNESVRDANNALSNIDTGKAKQSFADLRAEIDGNIEAQANLADEFSKTWGEVNANTSLVESYMAVIDELTSKYDENGVKVALTAEEQNKLAAAVAGINEITGQSISIIDGQNGVLSESTASIHANTDAWLANARAQAAQEELVELAKQQLANEEALEKATQAHAQAREQLNAAQDAGLYNMDEQLRRFDETEKALQDAQALYDENAAAQSKLAEKINETNQAISSSAESLNKYLTSRSDWASTLNLMGVDVDAFAQKLSELGFATTDLANLSDAGLKALARSYQGSTDDIIAICEQFGITVPETVRAAAETTAEAVEEVNDQIVEDATESGAEAGEGFADSLESKAPQTTSAAQLHNTVMLQGFHSGDAAGAGSQEGSAFAGGVSSSSPLSGAAGMANAMEASKGMQSQNKNAHGWGLDLGQLFASGIRAAQSFVSSAANFIGGIVKGILGHSVPKEGILREGGEGEARWGRHLVENIADGMREAKSDVESASDEIADTIDDALSFEAKESEWDVAVDVGESIAHGIVVGFDNQNPFANIKDTVANGAMMLSAMIPSGGDTINNTTVTNTSNFNQPVQTPYEYERVLRMQSLHGLQGAR